VPLKNRLEIVAPLPNTPATRAGIQAGDFVTRINGISVAQIGGSVAVNRIHGRAGTKVHLTLVRGSRKPFTVAVQRAAIAPITAYARMLGHHLGYLQILSFGNTTAKEVTEGLQFVERQHARGLILDLRDNPGGYVDAAQQVVSHFLSHGIVAYEEDNHHHLSALPVLKGEQQVSMPVAVLVNSGTASAAEITAGALHDEHVGEIIGTRTYGKGSMQSVYPLADGSTIRITDRLWLTPLKRSIQHRGITPDIDVQSTAAQTAAGIDSQLNRAESYLLHHMRS
jgi:carboxyl-terminal processing protease